MLVTLPPDAMVVRFRPSAPQAVLSSAEKENRRRFDPENPIQTYYRVSVFADVKREGEDADSLLIRLISAAELNGLDIGNNKHCWAATAGDLQELEVSFWKDGDDDEVPEHYSIDLGPSPTVEFVERILEAFEGPERTRP